MKNFTKTFFLCCIIFCLAGKKTVNAQAHFTASSEKEISSEKEEPKNHADSIEYIYARWYSTLLQVQGEMKANEKDFHLFTNFYQPYLDSEKAALFQQIDSKKLNYSNIASYLYDKKVKLEGLYNKFLDIKKDFPNSVDESQVDAPQLYAAQTCEAPCSNLNFATGTFSGGWYGYYLQNQSSATTYSFTAPTGGLLGAVSKGANDPATGTDQVHITSIANKDWFLKTYGGAANSMAQASPWDGTYAAMVGDSVNPHQGMALLSQTFKVSAALNSITYAYSAFLENPSGGAGAHTLTEQPFFKITILDGAGNVIPNCGTYDVVSSGGTTSGFKGIYYTPSADSVYWKDWTEVNVPLDKYVGQCITVQFETSDCSLGGHFGYAYVAVACVNLAITASSPVICPNSDVTLFGTAGEESYLWSGPTNGIVGSNTTQNITIDSGGTYTLVITPFTGALCADTVYFTEPIDRLKTTATPGNIKCFGGTGTATANPINGTAPYTYSWAPSGGNNVTAIGLAAGSYTVTVQDANGCSATASTTITQPTKLVATMGPPTNATCSVTGNATVTVSGATPPYTYSWVPSGGTGATGTGFQAGTYTVDVTDNNGCTTSATVTITSPSSLVTTTSFTPAFCNLSNGSVTVNVNGGTSPYTYLWNPTGQTTATATGVSIGTYTVVVTDNNDCSTTTNVTVTQPPPVLATIGPPTNVLCNGGNNGSATATVTGGLTPYTYNWVPIGGNNATANGLTAGTYTLTVQDANGCTSTATVTITQPPLLTATMGAPTNATCITTGSATVSVTGGTPPYTYSWVPLGGTGATGTGLIAGTYTVNVTDAHGCTATASVVITQPVPLGTTTSFTPAFCNLANGTATVNVTGGTTAYTYSWTPVGGNGATTIGVKAGTYTVLVTDHDGCTITTSVTVTQPPAVTASIGPITEVSCFGGNNGSITAIATGGPSPYTYSWNPTAQTTATATGLIAGNYTVTITDTNGCVSTAAATVTQPPLLTVTIGPPTNVLCNGGNNGSATSTVTGGTLPYTYMWSPTGGNSAIANGLIAGIYTVTVTDANGCVATATTTITQPTALGSTTSFVGAFCNLSNGSATVNVTGGTVPYTYLWNPSKETTATATGIPIGTYTVSIIDHNGCTTSNSVTVTQPPALLAIINGTTPVSCFGGNNGTTSATQTGGTPPYTYLWQPGGNKNQIAVGLIAGIYTVTITDANGCTSTASTVVTQPPLLAVTINGPQILCPGGATGTLTAITTGGTAPYTYAWSTGDTTVTASISPLTPTTYTVTVTDANGCKATNIITVNIYPLVYVSITGAASVCIGSSVTLCANVMAGTGGNVYSWQPGNYTTPCITVAPSVTTTYTVTVTDNCGSTATSSAKVQVNPLPDVNFDADIYQGCKPLCIQFYNRSTVADETTYSWSFGNGDTALRTNHPIYCYKDSGYYTVTLTVTSDSGCSATRRKINFIHVFGLPDAAFTISPQPADILNPTIQFTDQTTDPIVNRGLQYWTWIYGDNLDSVGTTQNTMHTYQDTGTYCVRLAVMDRRGCTDTVTNCLIIDPIFTLYIPNAFTPNGDGMDDIFTAKGVYVRTFEMYIFDRWGEQLYHTYDINKGWNGTVHGGTTMSQEDVYVYRIIATDWEKHQHNYIGRVTLLK